MGGCQCPVVLSVQLTKSVVFCCVLSCFAQNKMYVCMCNMLLGLPDLPYFTGAPVFETVSPVSRLIPIRETLSPVFQSLQYGWTVMDGVQPLLEPMQPGRRPGGIQVVNFISGKLVKLVPPGVRF